MYRNHENMKAIVRAVERRHKKSNGISIIVAVYNSSGVNLGEYASVSALGNKLYLDTNVVPTGKRKTNVYKVQRIGNCRQMVDITAYDAHLIDFIGAYAFIHRDNISGQYYLKLEECDPLLQYETQARAPFTHNSKKAKATRVANTVVETPAVPKDVDVKQKTPKAPPVSSKMDDKKEQAIKMLTEAAINGDSARAKVIAEMYNLMFAD